MERSNNFAGVAVVVGSLVALFALVVGLSSFGIMRVGEVGIKTRLGSIVDTVGTGLYFKLPFIETVNRLNLRTQTISFDGDSSLGSATKDLQDVVIATVVNYHIDPTKAVAIFTEFKSEDYYQSSVVEPIIRDTVKSVASNYTAEELVTKRAEFSDKVSVSLNERLSVKYAVVERTNITNLQFSKSFSEAIERKATAVQNAEAEKNKLEEVKFRAQQTVETAKAEAESIRIQAQAITSQGGADYVQLQAIAKWKGEVPQYVMGNSAVPFINLK